MQKIVSGKLVKEIDQAYINHAQITSAQLMERAARAFCDWFCQLFPTDKGVCIFVGTGNNGGDGVAIARLLWGKGYAVKVVYLGDLSKASQDFSINRNLLPEKVLFIPYEVYSAHNSDDNVLIDALFGVGINRPLDGDFAEVVKDINQRKATVVSVDMPSGLPSDSLVEGVAVNATYTVSFQFPKFSLLLPEHAKYTGKLVVKDIGIAMEVLDGVDQHKYWVEPEKVRPLHKTFHAFSHKGDFGKVLLIGGSYGKIGAILLATKAALRAGAGLVSTFCPSCGVDIIQSSIPEAMVVPGTGERELSLPLDAESFDALGLGPGMGQGDKPAELLEYVLKTYQQPLVLDADALNLLSAHKDWYGYLEGRVLTPHLKEFERLAGHCDDHIQRLKLAKDFAVDHKCVLVLKGAFTCINLPNGEQYFNSSGTPYLGTGGTGDALTGIITSFLGQGYSPGNAAIAGVFHHGLAGEIAARDKRKGMVASDVIEALPASFAELDVG
jgi:ADP-dependent NAD(P)H-hydrate dehydratase / NAD(P)H-hydrate epimerase